MQCTVAWGTRVFMNVNPPTPHVLQTGTVSSSELRKEGWGWGNRFNPQEAACRAPGMPLMSLSNGGVETSLPREHSERSVSTCCWKKIGSQWSQPPPSFPREAHGRWSIGLTETTSRIQPPEKQGYIFLGAPGRLSQWSV